MKSAKSARTTNGAQIIFYRNSGDFLPTRTAAAAIAGNFIYIT
jgi:hypothetical protein